jgi:hypothetical protein
LQIVFKVINRLTLAVLGNLINELVSGEFPCKWLEQVSGPGCENRQILIQTFYPKSTSARWSVRSSFSAFPLFLRPVEEVDAMKKLSA